MSASPLLQPEKLEMDGQELVITWNDGQRLRYAPAVLRAACPCATCNDARRKFEAVGATLTVDEGVTIRRMEPVGNYAYKIEFSDGHQTGIYRLEMLRELGAAEA